MTDGSAGRQLEGRELEQRQRILRASAGPGPSVVAVDVRTPENVGHLLRVADAAGCAEVLVVPRGELSPKIVRRAARMCDQHVRWRFTTEDEAMATAVGWGHPLWAVELTTASVSLFESHLRGPCTWVVGGERAGIPEGVLARCQRAVHVPMFGVNGSMNLTHALAIALFEWRRQNPASSP